jgi:hypothetical protein
MSLRGASFATTSYPKGKQSERQRADYFTRWGVLVRNDTVYVIARSVLCDDIVPVG